MAILKLYGASQATCTRRVATVLHELKVPFELVEVDIMNGEHKTAAYTQKQPFGQIPYIDDDGFILYETRAICRYIAAKHPESGLIPTDPKANALFEQAASVEVSNWDPSASKAGVELMRKGFGMVCDQAVVDAQLEILDKKLEGYEAILSKQRYVAGDSFTLADLFHIPYAPLVASGGSDIMTRKPNVARWYNELVARPSWLAYQDGGVKTTVAY
ncbi:glutathione S-transferase [Mycena albidolilacea]|uniref:glutathione transferase n=1 Tax=Mycena albidolilacea TaxID=1033008 RepID=A0AAD6ZRH5_9AGAR|nr:glutathione S-transferase [Mycena albidolilacea]